MKRSNPLRLSKRGSLFENSNMAGFYFNDMEERMSKKGRPRLFRSSPSSNIRLRLSKRSREARAGRRLQIKRYFANIFSGTRNQHEPMVIRLSKLQLGQILFNKRGTRSKVSTTENWILTSSFRSRFETFLSIRAVRYFKHPQSSEN